MLLATVMICMTACGKEEENNMNFSVIAYNVPEIREQEKLEASLRQCLENVEERVRLLYFKEQLEEDLKNEKAVEVRYSQPETIHSKRYGSITVERIIVFGSGRLKTEDTAEYIPIVTVDDEEVAVWYCRYMSDGSVLKFLHKIS